MKHDIFLPVQKVKVDDIMPGYEHPSGLSHAIIVEKPDGNRRVVQYCSSIYELVQNEKLVMPFYETLKKYYDVEMVTSMENWSRFKIDFVIKDHHVTVGNSKDILHPRISMKNSYDGSVRYNYSAGFFRLVCSNGMMVSEGDVKRLKLMHTPNILNHTEHGAIMEMLQEFLINIEDTSEVYQELNDQPTKDWMSRIEEVVEETSFPITFKEEVADRMTIELAEGLQPSDWLVYNAFNYQLNHATELKAKQGKRESVDQEVLEYLLKY